MSWAATSELRALEQVVTASATTKNGKRKTKIGGRGPGCGDAGEKKNIIKLNMGVAATLQYGEEK